jgi:hypothetical protein
LQLVGFSYRLTHLQDELEDEDIEEEEQEEEVKDDDFFKDEDDLEQEFRLPISANQVGTVDRANEGQSQKENLIKLLADQPPEPKQEKLNLANFMKQEMYQSNMSAPAFGTQYQTKEADKKNDVDDLFNRIYRKHYSDKTQYQRPEPAPRQNIIPSFQSYFDRQFPKGENTMSFGGFDPGQYRSPPSGMFSESYPLSGNLIGQISQMSGSQGSPAPGFQATYSGRTNFMSHFN